MKNEILIAIISGASAFAGALFANVINPILQKYLDKRKKYEDKISIHHNEILTDYKDSFAPFIQKIKNNDLFFDIEEKKSIQRLLNNVKHTTVLNKKAEKLLHDFSNNIEQFKSEVMLNSTFQNNDEIIITLQKNVISSYNKFCDFMLKL